MLLQANESSNDEPAARPLIDVVACEEVDASPLIVVAHTLGADVRISSSAESWFEQQSFAPSEGEDPVPADVTVMVSRGERMVGQRWVARAAATAPDAWVLAALVDATIEHACDSVNQGARGLVCLPAPPDYVGHSLKQVLELALKGQAGRRMRMRHRRGLASLTPAERDVLDGMLSGMANKQIAQRLSIGLRTVELRRSKIMRKMKATGIAQLISYVYAAGAVDP